MAFTLGRNIYILTLDEVEDGSYIHVHKPRRGLRGTWAKFDLVSVKLTEKDSDFFPKFPSVSKNPEKYIKAKSIAFPAYLPPRQYIQFCDETTALQNDSEMRFMKYLCDVFKYDCKISAECPC